MVEPRETAEEQLLRFIEGSRPVRPVAPLVPPTVPARIQAGWRRFWGRPGAAAQGLLWLALLGVAAYAALELKGLQVPVPAAPSAAAPAAAASPWKVIPRLLSARSHIEDLSRNLVVVGIDRGAHPVAFVEDVQEKRTYLVGVGDRLNGMVVEEIGPKGVLLSYDEQEVLLP